MRGSDSAPVAQLDRVSGYEPEGRAFESLRARQSDTSLGTSTEVPIFISATTSLRAAVLCQFEGGVNLFHRDQRMLDVLKQVFEIFEPRSLSDLGNVRPLRRFSEVLWAKARSKLL